MEGAQDEDGKAYDEKNIRRRIYDALNVLIALDIIHKDRKQIIWKGLPGRNMDEIEALSGKKQELQNSIRTKVDQLKELVAAVGA